MPKAKVKAQHEMKTPNISDNITLLLSYIHFINIYFRQHNYIIKHELKLTRHVST